jgi:hypothetical protein
MVAFGVSVGKPRARRNTYLLLFVVRIEFDDVVLARKLRSGEQRDIPKALNSIPTT